MYRLLVADDSKTIQKVVRLTFAGEGFQVDCLSDGREAWEHLRRWGADIVLADVALPGKDGYELCRQVKRESITAGVPFVLLAGSLQPIDEERFAAAGADTLLIKPFETAQLVSTVEELIARRRAEQERLVSASLPVDGPVPASVPESVEEADHRFPLLFELSRDECLLRFDLLSREAWKKPGRFELTEDQYREIVERVARKLPEALRDLVPEVAREVLRGVKASA